MKKNLLVSNEKKINYKIMIGEFSLMTYGLLSLVDDVEIWVDNDVEISTNRVDHDIDRWNSDSEQTIRQSLKIQIFL